MPDYLPDLKIWSFGNEFQAAASLLNEELLKDKEKNIFWVAALNASFAIELYLKSFLAKRVETGTGVKIEDAFEIMQYNSASDRGHNLLTLYNKIDPKYQAYIDSSFQELFPDTNYMKEIERYKDYFMGARYRYEKGAVGCVTNDVVYFAEKLRDVVYDVAKHTDPTYKNA